MNKQIFKLALPNILSNITVPLMASVDVALAGSFGDESYLAALAFAGAIFSMLYWTLGFLRMGTVGFTAQAYGQGDASEQNAVLYRCLLIALVLATLILLFQTPISVLLLDWAQVSDHLTEMTLRYYDVRIWAAPATLMVFVFHGWLLGRQNAIIPMVIIVVANLLNILLSWYLSVRLGMDIEGIALGTTIAQYVSLVLAIGAFFYLCKKEELPLKNYDVFIWERIAAFFKLNFFLWLRTVGLVIAFFMFNIFSVRIGEIYLATNEVLAQYIIWMAFTIDGFASAAESLVGRYKGERNVVMITKVVRYVFVWAFGLAVLFAVFYGFGNPYITPLFTSSEKIISLSAKYVDWLVVMPIVGFVCYIWDGIFTGLTKGGALLYPMIFALLVYVFLANYYQTSLGNHSVWLAWVAFLVSRSVVQTVLWFYYVKQGKLIKK